MRVSRAKYLLRLSEKRVQFFGKQPLVEDLDDDCQVTVIDIMQVTSRWGEGSGSPGDVNGDGTVDVNDVQQAAGKWRETCHVLAEVVKYYVKPELKKWKTELQRER